MCGEGKCNGVKERRVVMGEEKDTTEGVRRSHEDAGRCRPEGAPEARDGERAEEGAVLEAGGGSRRGQIPELGTGERRGRGRRDEGGDAGSIVDAGPSC